MYPRLWYVALKRCLAILSVHRLTTGHTRITYLGIYAVTVSTVRGPLMLDTIGCVTFKPCYAMRFVKGPFRAVTLYRIKGLVAQHLARCVIQALWALFIHHSENVPCRLWLFYALALCLGPLPKGPAFPTQFAR